MGRQREEEDISYVTAGWVCDPVSDRYAESCPITLIMLLPSHDHLPPPDHSSGPSARLILNSITGKHTSWTLSNICSHFIHDISPKLISTVSTAVCQACPQTGAAGGHHRNTVRPNTKWLLFLLAGILAAAFHTPHVVLEQTVFVSKWEHPKWWSQLFINYCVSTNHRHGTILQKLPYKMTTLMSTEPNHADVTK